MPKATSKQPAAYAFDRYLRYEELVSWIEELCDAHPDLVTAEEYGHSYEGRPLILVTVTDSRTGDPFGKPAHWVDASIHAVELTATVAACRLLQRLVDGYRDGDETITRALQTRTFYVVPRVNPDGAEWALDDRPRFRRSSVRPWPMADAHRWPGLHVEDVDGDGRILQMRLPDLDGPWMPHPDDARLMVPVPATGAPSGVARYRILDEGAITDFDGFTIPATRPPEGLDLNRNFPAGWGTNITGAGDHPLSEPEIDALVRAIVARPNICGFNAFHTSGGVLLRPSSTKADAALPPGDVWAWKQLAAIGTELTGYPSHSVYEDFTWDSTETMSGASDDWAYEHLGVYGWTTEFWDIVHAATGEKQSTLFWYTGPTDAQALAVLHWLDQFDDERTAGFVDWYPFDHPDLGSLELGGWNTLTSWTNPPPHLLLGEVDKHADFAIAQALAAPCIRIRSARVESVGPTTWRVTVGISNTGWLPTYVTEHARKQHLVEEIIADIQADGEMRVIDGPERRKAGQLAGASAAQFTGSTSSTPDRTTCSWLIEAAPGSHVRVTVYHQRAGNDDVALTLEARSES